jgi:hypothetical protein
MSKALRGRVNQLADRMEFAAECKLSMRPTNEQASDLRALLAAHREAKRQNAAMRKALRIMGDIHSDMTAMEILGIIVESQIELNLKGVRL